MLSISPKPALSRLPVDDDQLARLQAAEFFAHTALGLGCVGADLRHNELAQ